MLAGRTGQLFARPFINRFRCVHSATFVSGSERDLGRDLGPNLGPSVRAHLGLKKGQSPYNLFVSKNYQAAREAQGPNFNRSTDVIRSLAAQWKNLPQQEKEPFVRESLIVRAENSQILKGISEEEKEAMLKEQKERHKAKIIRARKTLASEHGKPKRPSPPFVQFCNENRSKQPKFTSLRDAANYYKIMGREWRALDPEKKQEFQKKFTLAMQEHRETVMAWEQGMRDKGQADVLEKMKPQKPVKKAPAAPEPIRNKAKKVTTPKKKAARAGAAKRKTIKRKKVAKKSTVSSSESDAGK